MKIKQIDDKFTLLHKKQNWLVAAKEASKEAKLEYDIILSESRDHDLKKIYGADKVLKAKELAKIEFSNCETKRKTLEKEVDALIKTLNESKKVKVQLLVSLEDTQMFLNDMYDIDWSASVEPTLVKGN